MKTLTRHVVLEGRYVLERQIGRGRTSSVWRAADTVLDRTVAVKVLHPHLAADSETATRFVSAARRAAGLSHPNIVSVYDTGVESGTPFLVMELIEGEALGRKIETSGPLEPDEAVQIAIDVLDAMDAAWKAGLASDKLVAEDVFLGPGDRIRIAGFGDSFSVRTDDPAHIGTNGNGNGAGNVEQQASAGAAAALLYRMLCGRAPVEPIAAPRSLRSRIPKDLDALVTKALAPEHTIGYASVGELRAALSRFSLGSGEFLRVPDAPEEGGSGAVHGIFRSWMLVPAGLVILVAVVIAAGFVAGRLGNRAARAASTLPPPPATTPVREHMLEVRQIPIESATATDPFGDGKENDSSAALAIDGSTRTSWSTEQYYSGGMQKPGVGLLLDLGAPQTVTKFRLDTPQPGFTFQVRIGNDPRALGKAKADEYRAVAGPTRKTIKPTAGRYVLVWITSVTDAGTAQISNFEVAGPVA